MVLMLSIGIIAAFGAALFWTASQLLSKTVAPRIGNFKTAGVIAAVGLIPMVVLFVLSPVLVSTNNLILSGISGIALALGYILFYRSVETQQISNAAATALIQPAILVFYAVLVLGESVNSLQSVGILAIFIGVILLDLTKKLKFNRKMIPAIVGNGIWALYWIFLAAAINSSHQIAEPLLVSRSTAVVVILVALLLFLGEEKHRTLAKTKYIPLALLFGIVLVEGIADGSGNIAFGTTVNLNLLGLGSVLLAAEPIFIAIVAHFMYKDRLSKIQTMGVLLAAAGAAVIALL